MLARVCSAAVSGIDAFAVEVEVNCGYGETFIAIVVKNTPKLFSWFFFAVFHTNAL
jgi:hypothetical protein